MAQNTKIKSVILIGFILFMASNGFGQVAIIQDKDGFTNVRSEPNTKSEIIYKLYDNEVFFYFDASDDSKTENTDWFPVMIPRNKFSIRTGIVDPYYGYIHKSRLKPLDELEEVAQSDNQLVFNVSKVDTLYKQVDVFNEDDNSRRYHLIDGFMTYGYDIYLHQCTEVNSIDLLWDGQLIPQSRILVQDLYNVSFETGEYKSNTKRFKQYINGDVTFIHQQCSDGGGYFEIVWVVKQQRIIQRLAGSLF